MDDGGSFAPQAASPSSLKMAFRLAGLRPVQVGPVAAARSRRALQTLGPGWEGKLCSTGRWLAKRTEVARVRRFAFGVTRRTVLIHHVLALHRPESSPIQL